MPDQEARGGQARAGRQRYQEDGEGGQQQSADERRPGADPLRERSGDQRPGE